MKKYDFVCLLSREIFSLPASALCMALWNYSNTGTLFNDLRGLENVSKKSVCKGTRDAPKVSKSGLTLSLTLLVNKTLLTLGL